VGPIPDSQHRKSFFTSLPDNLTGALTLPTGAMLIGKETGGDHTPLESSLFGSSCPGKGCPGWLPLVDQENLGEKKQAPQNIIKKWQLSTFWV